MEKTDWLDELAGIDWAVASLGFLLPAGSLQKELTENAIRGIKSRLQWIRAEAAAERKAAREARK